MKKILLLGLLLLTACGSVHGGNSKSTIVKRYDDVLYDYDMETTDVVVYVKVTEKEYDRYYMSVRDIYFAKIDNRHYKNSFYILTNGYLLVVYYYSNPQ